MTHKMEEVDLDLSWAGDYKSEKYSPSHNNRPRGSDKAFVKVQVGMVQDVNEFAKGFVLGALYEAGLSIKDVIFAPADTVEHVNTFGKPVYVQLVTVEREQHYEIETWFRKKEEV